MDRGGSHSASDSPPHELRAGEPVAPDAAADARADFDGVAAAEARARYRTHQMEALEPDATIAPLLCPDEPVLAVRHDAVYDRRESKPASEIAIGMPGALYVTARRLVIVGRVTLSFELAEIEEAVSSGERLLLVLRDGTGVSLEVAQPRLLRVEIGAARAAARA